MDARGQSIPNRAFFGDGFLYQRTWTYSFALCAKNKYSWCNIGPAAVFLEEVQGLSIELEGFIYVGRLISESPFMEYDGVSVPTLEMNIVDQIASGHSFEDEFQKIMEVYPVNYDRLSRYASRRGVSDKLESAIRGLDRSRMEMFAKVQTYLKSMPVLQAWVFGSFARLEETPRSDLDLLIKYDRTQKVSLLDISKYILDLEAAIGREVDLIEYRSLKPFAVQSAERDKYLIYER